MKIIKIFVPIFLTFVLIYSLSVPAIATAEEINTKVLRLHILANSNSSYDQNIKLGLRDYFLEETRCLFTADNINDNIEIAKDNLQEIENICNNYLTKYNLSASVKVDKEFFETRVYDDYTLPAGVYNAIIITIG